MTFHPPSLESMLAICTLHFILYSAVYYEVKTDLTLYEYTGNPVFINSHQEIDYCV